MNINVQSLKKEIGADWKKRGFLVKSVSAASLKITAYDFDFWNSL